MPLSPLHPCLWAPRFYLPSSHLGTGAAMGLGLGLGLGLGPGLGWGRSGGWDCSETLRGWSCRGVRIELGLELGWGWDWGWGWSRASRSALRTRCGGLEKPL